MVLGAVAMLTMGAAKAVACTTGAIAENEKTDLYDLRGRYLLLPGRLRLTHLLSYIPPWVLGIYSLSFLGL